MLGSVDGDHARVYQPQVLRKELQASGLAAKDLLVDCVDINPRVLRCSASACSVAAQLNVVTDRPREGWTRYDLIIATNVLLYMDDRELLLAFHNIRSMLSTNGAFIHNDGRFEIQLFGKAAGLSPVRLRNCHAGFAPDPRSGGQVRDSRANGGQVVKPLALE